MKKTLLLVAALLLTTQTNLAVAAEEQELFPHYTDTPLTPKNEQAKSKKAKKILIMLRALGISDPQVDELVQTIDSRTSKGYFNLYEERIGSGSLTMRYAVKARVGIKQLELRYVPDDSNIEYTARTNAVMMNYKLNF